MSRKTYVRFVEVPQGVEVQTLRGDELGVIRWYAPWRQHVFMPGWDTEFSFDCLEDIAAKVKAMNEARKQAKQGALL